MSRSPQRDIAAGHRKRLQVDLGMQYWQAPLIE
jgi:hypothetical protein